MLQACQEWSEKSRIQINTDKTKIMVFHEEAAAKKLRTSPIGPTYNNARVTYPTPFYILSSFPAASPYSNPLEEVDEFTYLGLTLDNKVSMKAEMKSCQWSTKYFTKHESWGSSQRECGGRGSPVTEPECGDRGSKEGEEGGGRHTHKHARAHTHTHTHTC
jgi:hypothetical protein